MSDRPRVRTEFRGAMGRLFREWRDHPEIVISGPAGTGKTRGILEWIHYRCSTEKVKVLLTRKTLESLKTSALATYQEQVLYGFDGRRSDADAVNYFGGSGVRPSQFTYEKTGSTITVGGLDRPSKILSTEYDLIYVNEATEIEQGVWEQLGGRTDRPKMGRRRSNSLLLGDCNPSAPTHWIKLRGDDGALALWPTYHTDNPAMWDTAAGDWTEAGRRYLQRLEGYSGVLRQRFLMGIWAAAEGQIYESFDPRVHVLKNADAREFVRWTFGVCDWGWTNPGALQVWGVDNDSRIYLLHEVYQTKRTVDGWWVPKAVGLHGHYKCRDWLGDPSEPQYIALFNAAGVPMRKAVNDILPGIAAVQERLKLRGDGRPGLYLMEGALHQRDAELERARLPWSTEQEFGLYTWYKPPGGETLADRPVDAYNHGLDCVRYACSHMDLQTRVATLRPLTPQMMRHWQGYPRATAGRRVL